MLEYFVIIGIILIYLFFLYSKPKNKYSKINQLMVNYPEDIFIISDSNCTNKEKDPPLPKCNNCNYCMVQNLVNLESIDDILSAISNITKPTINIILHTEGGESDAPDTLANILHHCKKKVKIYIPNYAYSSGTMIALSGDEIYMNWYSTCSPIDVQMEVSHDNELEESYSTKHIRKLKNCKPKDDRQYLQGCEAEDYHIECEELVRKILSHNSNVEKIITELVNHSVSHSKSFTRDELEELNLPIKRGVPIEIMNIFNEFKKIFIN